MTVETKFRKGQSVLGSEKGHRGFYYPALDARIIIQEDCTALLMTGYVGTQGKTAYSIPASAVEEGDRYDDSVPYMVVWK